MDNLGFFHDFWDQLGSFDVWFRVWPRLTIYAFFVSWYANSQWQAKNRLYLHLMSLWQPFCLHGCMDNAFWWHIIRDGWFHHRFDLLSTLVRCNFNVQCAMWSTTFMKEDKIRSRGMCPASSSPFRRRGNSMWLSMMGMKQQALWWAHWG